MAKTIYCMACGSLNKNLYGQLADCKTCNEKLSDAAEIKTPRVLLRGLGKFILRKGLSRRDIAQDIKILEANREITQNAIQCSKLKETKVKRLFNNDGTTPLLRQLLKQSVTPEQLTVEKDLHRIRVTLDILRDELETLEEAEPSATASSQNLFRLIAERQTPNKTEE